MNTSSVKIKFELIGLVTKFIDCQEINCKFRTSCANHTTAGDFRIEDGFSPELFFYQGDCYCKTKEMPEMDGIEHEVLPINYDVLCRGAKYLTPNNMIVRYES